MDCASMSLDDLDEKLFAVELSNCQAEKQQRPRVSGSHKRRPWHWKHALPNSIDKRDMGVGKAQSSSSLENSRRGSICSNSQSSPIKNSSPKKSKDQQSKKTTIDNKDDINHKIRKDSNVMCDSTFSDDRLAAANAHLYSLLEEQALGEIIRESVENVYTEGNNRSIQFCATAALSSNTWYYHSSYDTVGWRKSHHAMIPHQTYNYIFIWYTLAHTQE